MKSVTGTIVAAMTVVLTGAACRQDAEHPAPEPKLGSAGSGRRAGADESARAGGGVVPATARACMLLTKADIEGIGRPVASVDTDTATRCTYLVGDGIPSIGLVVETPELFDAGRSLLGATPVAGVGAAAYWQDEVGALHVRTATSVAFLVQSTERKGGDIKGSLQRLATTVADRLR